MNIYKTLGVNQKTAKPGDLMLAAQQKQKLMKTKKYKKVKNDKDADDVKKKGKKSKAQPKLGTGKRFQNLTRKLAGKGAKNPKALAAFIGRKKFGAKKMAQLAAKGKK